MLDAAPPLSAFLVQELTSRVDMRTAEGRAKFLQEAKPLVKQMSAPMLSLMLRKQIAELAGVSQAELDRNFEIKVGMPRAQVPARREAVKPSMTRNLAEMLALKPSLAALAPPRSHYEGVGVQYSPRKWSSFLDLSICA